MLTLVTVDRIDRIAVVYMRCTSTLDLEQLYLEEEDWQKQPLLLFVVPSSTVHLDTVPDSKIEASRPSLALSQPYS